MTPCDKPRPGPLYWDWRCLNCDQPITAHENWLTRTKWLPIPRLFTRKDRSR